MSLRNKVIDIKSLKKLKDKFKRKKIVLCHGVFDLLHVGHINYFQSAKKLGDILVVSTTDDKFVNKGPGRPAFTINNRIKFLKEINCIDYVCVSNDFTSEKIIKSLKPNFYCKGSDYSLKNIKKDKNLKKEIDALTNCRGKFNIIKEPSFSSSKYINENELQNISQECKKFINSLRNEFTQNDVSKFLSNIENKKVLVIGDTIIDKYITTEAIGKSGKEPMMVVQQKKQIKFLGGVGYIANLCSSFVKETKMISFLGDKNSEKKYILKNLNKKIIHNFLIKKNSPTIVKTRYLDDYRKTKMLGVYELNDDLISKQEESKFYKLLKYNLNKYDIIIVADYGHGIITEKIRHLIMQYSNKLFLNTQINSFNRGYHSVFKYKKMNSYIINESELRYEMKDRTSDLEILTKRLSKKISLKNIIVTKGRWGADLFNIKNRSIISCPAFNENTIDTVGVGDTFFALSSITIGSKINNKIGLLISSLAASYSINQLGNTSTFNFDILKKHLGHIFK